MLGVSRTIPRNAEDLPFRAETTTKSWLETNDAELDDLADKLAAMLFCFVFAKHEIEGVDERVRAIHVEATQDRLFNFPALAGVRFVPLADYLSFRLHCCFLSVCVLLPKIRLRLNAQRLRARVDHTRFPFRLARIDRAIPFGARSNGQRLPARGCGQLSLMAPNDGQDRGL